MPVMFFIVSFPEQIIRLIFERGAFGPNSTAMTAELLSVYNAGIGSALVVFMLPLWMCSCRWFGGRRPGRHSQCIARSDGLRAAGRLDTRFGYPRGAERPEQRIGCPRRSRCDCRYDRTFGGRRNPAHGSDPKCTGNGFTVRYGRAYPFFVIFVWPLSRFGTCRYGCLSRKRGRISCRRREAGGIDAQR